MIDRLPQPLLRTRRNHSSLRRALSSGCLLLLLLPPAFAQNRKPTPSFTQLAAQAAAARDAGHLTEAVALYQQAVRLRPTWQEGWWALGTSLYELERFAPARTAFARLTALAPQAAAAWAMRGLCEFQLRAYAAALVQLQRARAQGCCDNRRLQSIADYHAALLLNRAARFEAAEAILKTLARAGEENDELLIAFGLSALRANVLPTELAPAQRSLALQTGQASFYAATNRPNEARRACADLTTQHADAPAAHYACGILLLREYPDEALTAFRRTLAAAPAHVEARLQIALEHLKRNEPDLGLPLAVEAVQLAPRHAAARYALGRLLLAERRADEAVSELARAARLAPHSPEIWFALAQSYDRAGRRADATRARNEFSRLEKSRAGTPPAR